MNHQGIKFCTNIKKPSPVSITYIEQHVGKALNELEKKIAGIFLNILQTNHTYNNQIKGATINDDQLIEIPGHTGAFAIKVNKDKYVAFCTNTYQINDEKDCGILTGNETRKMNAKGFLPAGICHQFSLAKETDIEKIINAFSMQSNPLSVSTLNNNIDKITGNKSIAQVLVSGISAKNQLIAKPKNLNKYRLYLIGSKTAAFIGKEDIVGYTIFDKLLVKTREELSATAKISCFSAVEEGGILLSAFSMINQCGFGLQLDLSNLPVADEMHTEALLVSASPGRLMVAVEENDIPLLEEVCNKYEINCTKSGEILDKKKLSIISGDKEIACIPFKAFQPEKNEPPVNQKEKTVAGKTEINAKNLTLPDSLKESCDLVFNNISLLSTEKIDERFEQFAGRRNLNHNFHADTTLLKINDNNILALSFWSKQQYILEDTYNGTLAMLADNARKVACSGATAMGIIIELGIPEDNKNMKEQIQQIIEAINHFSVFFNVPIISKNITILHYSNSGSPLLTAGVAGLISNKTNIPTYSFKKKGDMIYLLGNSSNDLSSSSYIESIEKNKQSSPPCLNLAKEQQIQKATRELIEKEIIHSAHSVSKGGIFLNLVESCLEKNYGFDITSDAELPRDVFLFNEGQGRVVITVNPQKEDDFIDYMMKHIIPFSALGHVTKEELRIDDISAGFILDIKEKYTRGFQLQKPI